MPDIKLKAHLCAYAKGVLPTKLSELENDLEFIADAPKDNLPYLRKDGEWIEAESALHGKDILAGKGITVEDIDRYTVKINVNEWTGTEEEFDAYIAEHGYDEQCTYYIIENTPDAYINGGTSFTGIEAGNKFKQELDGGKSSTLSSQYQVETLPINSKGVYND